MDVNTLQFWQTVKSEYNPYKIFICYTSNTFETEWEGQKKGDIMYLANIFLQDTELEKSWYVSNIFTFRPISNFSSMPDIGFIRIREQFIDWCIKRFEK